ncbi:hypothetical protein J6590_003345 [Homalodisca vitripennis]|nr:hypothetical protein J6590_003345 [Homalodisca vitripennis]
MIEIGCGSSGPNIVKSERTTGSNNSFPRFAEYRRRKLAEWFDVREGMRVGSLEVISPNMEPSSASHGHGP